jgi:hypothetical protein
VRHASSSPNQQASASASLTSLRYLTPSPPAVLVAVNSSYLPTRSPSDTTRNTKTPVRHALRPRPTRATTAAAHNRRPPATSRKVCLNHTQSIARLPCLLSAVSRPARPAFRKPALQPIYRQSIRFPCDSLRLLALCTRMPRSPSIRRTIVRGA